VRILCLVAHPDDETVFAGGTLALLAERGAEVRILCCTRGEGGEAGEPPLCPRPELGDLREAELRCAAHALGCVSADCLPFRDPDIGPDGALHAFAASPREIIPEILRRLSPMGIDVLITHGSNGEYGHPGHLLTHRAGCQAARLCGIPFLYSFSADYHDHPRKRSANRDDPADFIIPVNSVFERKLAAMTCHRTQGALFVRRASAAAGHPVLLRDVILRRESFHRIPTHASTEAGVQDVAAFLQDILVPG
jgi:LmbE family N-acetylglucosaminyl deacetylase